MFVSERSILNRNISGDVTRHPCSLQRQLYSTNDLLPKSNQDIIAASSLSRLWVIDPRDIAWNSVSVVLLFRSRTY